jgi:hypothetical protein
MENSLPMPSVAEGLTTTLNKNGLDVRIVQSIHEHFIPFLEDYDEWHEKAMSIQVTDVSQKDLMKDAKTARLAIVKKRTAADKVRAALKQDSLNYGRAVQDAYKHIESHLVVIEEHLKAQEEYAERLERERINKLVSQRELIIQNNGIFEFLPVSGTQLAYVEDSHFETLVATAIEAKAKKEEEERLRKMQQDELIAQYERERKARAAAEAELEKVNREALAKKQQEEMRAAEDHSKELDVPNAESKTETDGKGHVALLALGTAIRSNQDLMVEVCKQYFEEYDFLLATDKDVVHNRVLDLMRAVYVVAKRHNL